MSDYLEGVQPCDDFQEMEETVFKNNRHECPGCCGYRTRCENCGWDHHTRGWDNCTSLLRARLERIVDALEDAYSGLTYIQQRYGLLDGVGWKRIKESAVTISVDAMRTIGTGLQ